MPTTWMFAGLFLGALSLAAAWDLAVLRIPNRLTAAIAIMGPVAAWALLPGPGAAAAALVTGAVMLGFGWTMFALGWWGGGDAKLAAAASLWLGAEATMVFVLATALFGAILAGLLLVLSRWPVPRSVTTGRWRTRLEADTVSVPYAVAMAPAGAVALSVRLSGVI